MQTVVGLEQLAGGGEEVLQLEVAGSLQRHAEAFGVPAPLPQDVLGEASGPRAHVAEVEELAHAVLGDGDLHAGHRSQLQRPFKAGGRSNRASEAAHPLRALWVGEHVVEAVVDVGHLHGRPERRTRQVGFSPATVRKIHRRGLQSLRTD